MSGPRSLEQTSVSDLHGGLEELMFQDTCSSRPCSRVKPKQLLDQQQEPSMHLVFPRDDALWVAIGTEHGSVIEEEELEDWTDLEVLHALEPLQALVVGCRVRVVELAVLEQVRLSTT